MTLAEVLIVARVLQDPYVSDQHCEWLGGFRLSIRAYFYISVRYWENVSVHKKSSEQ